MQVIYLSGCQPVHLARNIDPGYLNGRMGNGKMNHVKSGSIPYLKHAAEAEPLHLFPEVLSHALQNRVLPVPLLKAGSIAVIILLNFSVVGVLHLSYDSL